MIKKKSLETPFKISIVQICIMWKEKESDTPDNTCCTLINLKGVVHIRYTSMVD